jgi:AcrR family transcriptional regulator
VPPRGRRPAGGSDTREAILGAASELFAHVGFERTTMREVASRAEVDPALIHHYFTNKDGLLAAALALPVDPAALLAGLDQDPEHAGREIVRRVLGMWESDQETRRRLLALMRVGLAHEHAAGVLRDLLGRTILAAVARVVAEDERPLRAALVGTQMGGLLLGRYLLGIPAVRDATPQQLVVAIGPVIQHYLTGPIGERGGPASAPSGPGARRRAGGRNRPVPTGRGSAPSPKA